MFRSLAVIGSLVFASAAWAQGYGHAYDHTPSDKSSIVVACPFESNLTCGSQTAAITRASSAWCENSSGQFIEATSGNGCFGVRGLSVWQSVTNVARESLTIDTNPWVNDGTPTVTADTSSGPFDTYSGGAEADKIEDDNGSGWEGRYATYATTDTGDWTFSAWYKAGTLDKALVRISATGGTGTGNCNINGFTSTFARFTCTKTLGGSMSAVRGYHRPGQATSDTGTIEISGSQLENTSFAGRPCVAGASATTCASDDVTVSTVGWPVKQGSGCLTYSPDVAGDPAATVYLLDTRTGTNGYSVYIDTAGDLFATSGTASATTTTAASANPTWAAGTEYRICWSWNRGRLAVSRNGVEQGSAASPNIPTALNANAGICQTAASGSHCNGFFKGLIIYR